MIGTGRGPARSGPQWSHSLSRSDESLVARSGEHDMSRSRLRAETAASHRSRVGDRQAVMAERMSPWRDPLGAVSIAEGQVRSTIDTCRACCVGPLPQRSWIATSSLEFRFQPSRQFFPRPVSSLFSVALGPRVLLFCFVFFGLLTMAFVSHQALRMRGRAAPPTPMFDSHLPEVTPPAMAQEN